MTSLLSNQYSPIGLVNPTVKKPAVPDDGLTLPTLPGAGSATPIGAPQPMEGVTALPFGNGVTPVLKAEPTINLSGISPVNTVSAPPAGPVADPMVNPTAPGASVDNGNVQGTLIAPRAGADPVQDLNYWRQQFAGDSDPGPDLSADPLDPRVGAWNSRVDTAAGALDNTDRRGMLNQLLADFDKQSTERTSNLLNLSGRKSAALGRVGSGMAAQDIDQITRQALGDREIFRNQLAADTIDKEIGDRFGKLSAFQSVGNDAWGQASSDRGFKYGVASDNRNARTQGKLNAANMAGSFFDRADTARRNDRNEYRTERDYQDSREQTGIDRKLQQVQVEEALKSGDFNRALQLLQQGKTGNPAGALAGASSDLSGQSSQTAQLLMQFLNSMGYGSRAA